jgi:hypothetical protein
VFLFLPRTQPRLDCLGCNSPYILYILSITLGEDTKSFCQNLANQLSRVTDIPIECTKYPDVVRQMKARIAERDRAIATLGMRAGEGTDVRRALSNGTLSQAQVTRKFTQHRQFSKNGNK